MLEQMYADFNERILPLVSQGLTITYDYFTDLFGRYIKYLIISDIVIIVSCFLFTVFSIVAVVRLHNWIQAQVSRDKYSDAPILYFAIFLFGALIISPTLILLGSHVDGLIKALVVPEIRVYEELKSNNVIPQ